jgi:predicted GH43/DUF377 family glycosyl hydrolase
MSPETNERQFVLVNNVVFPTGIDQCGPETFDVCHGMADGRIGVCPHVVGFGSG